MIGKMLKDVTLSLFLNRWPVDETKREVVGTEECNRIDAMLDGLIQTEPLLHRGQRDGLQ